METNQFSLMQTVTASNSNNISTEYDYFSNLQCSQTNSSQQSMIMFDSGIDINNNSPIFNQSRDSISPSLSVQESKINFDSNIDSPGSLFQTASPNRNSSTPDDRTQTRRLKNRESAARSRQKIKNLLIDLENSMRRLQSKKEALVNEKYSIMKEVDRLESAMFSLKIKAITDSLKTENYTTWDSLVEYIPEMDLEKVKDELTSLMPAVK